MSPNRAGEQGIALVIVLWGVTLLALIAASLARTSGLAVRRMSHAIEAAQAHAALEEAVAAAELALADHRWSPDGARRRLTLAAAEAEVTVSSEAGKIDLNHAPAVLLNALFHQSASSLEEGDRLFAAFTEWTMPGTGGRALLAVSELAALPGMTAPVYRRLARATTVHNEAGRLDWRLAGESVLAAIPGLTDQARATLLAKQGQRDYGPDLAMAQAFAAAGVTEGPLQPDPGVPLFATLQVSVHLASHAAASGEILVRLALRDPHPVTTLEWHEPQWQEEE